MMNTARELAEAPFVRSPFGARLALRCVLVAAAPCVLMALDNTGMQTNLAFAAGAAQPNDWRAAWIAAVGLGHSAASPLDCVALGALYFVPLLFVVAAAGALVEAVFARARGRVADHAALPVIALLLTLSLPATLPLGQAALASALGIAFGKEIFGGFGRNFVNPVVVALAFLVFAYPGAAAGDFVWVPVDGHAAPAPISIAGRSGFAGLQEAGFTWSALALGWVPGPLGHTSPLACLIGLVVLLYSGAASWRIVVGGVLGLGVAILALQPLGGARPLAELPVAWHLVSGSFVFGLVFLATDPVTSAATSAGRWMYGAFIGAFVALVRIANPTYEDGTVLALLMGNVSAPLIDRAVGWWQLNRRRGARGA
jgi:Na+-transporting NADH:ubiquinone oxidoreductase subunit B